MATLSGRLMFDRARTAAASPALPGIANVPIVLQDSDSGAMLAVLTDANGNYAFINVPNGFYRIIEYYGMTPAGPTPGDFTAAVTGTMLGAGVVPLLSYAPSPVPAGATHLDCVTPSALGRYVNQDYADLDFLNGPVRYTPISAIIDSHAVILAENILDDADEGTFGSWPPSTSATNVMFENPYPGVGTGFTYKYSSWPSDGEFSIMNINNYGYANWWRFTDHTSGLETGRMMVINGYDPGAVIYEETVTVKPDTYYLFTTWILNAMKVTGLANPALGVQVLDENGQVLYDETLGTRIPVNVNTPEWVEIGSVIYSGTNVKLTVKFVSQGPAADGNDYVIDDIGLYEVAMVPELAPVKTCSAQNANVGDTVTYTVTLLNVYDRAITNVVFKDLVPDGLVFVAGSVTVNGRIEPAADPNAGFALPDVPGGETVTVTFAAKAVAVPPVNPTLNKANITFEYTIVEGGFPSPHNTESNEVPLTINEPKPKKTCSCRSPVTKCRRNIKGQKIWADNGNVGAKRPEAIEVILLRDGKEYKRKRVDSETDWTFCFCCVPKNDNSGNAYDYQLEETDVPGYTKKIEGFTITNTLSEETPN